MYTPSDFNHKQISTEWWPAMNPEVRERWPVIDTHFHIGVNTMMSFIAEEELIPEMDEFGIDIQILFQVNEGFYHRTPEWNPYVGNDYVAKIQNMFPSRVLGLATINPWLQAPKRKLAPGGKQREALSLVKGDPCMEELERAILELGLHGLKMHPLEHNYAFNDPHIIRPVMDKLVELQERSGRKIIIVVHAAGDSLNNCPAAIADMAKHYPELLYLAAHCGYIWGYATVGSCLGPLSNIMLDLTACPQKQVVWEVYQDYGAQRFTAGTDCPYVSRGITRAIIDDLASSNEEWELIAGGNLAKYLGIPPIRAGLPYEGALRLNS